MSLNNNIIIMHYLIYFINDKLNVVKATYKILQLLLYYV